MRDDIAAAWTARTAREGGDKKAQMPERLMQFMGTADPKVALVDLSAIAVSEGLDTPALRGLGGLLWDVAQRVAMVNVGKVEVFADMPATDLRQAGQTAIETTARKLLRDNKLGTIIVGGGTITAPEGTEIFEAGGLPVMVNKARAEKDFPRDYVKQIQAKQVSATPAFRTTVEIATKQTNTFGYVVTYDTHGDISATESLDVATGDRALGKHRAAEDQAADSADASSMSVGPRRRDADVELQGRGRARLEQTQRNRQTAGDNFAELAPSIIALGNTNLKQAIMTDRMRELEDKIRGGTITRQLFKQVFRPEYTRTAADWTDEEKAAVNQALAPFIATLEFEDSTKPASKSWRDTEENRINGTNAETSAVSMSIGPRAKLDAVQARLDALDEERDKEGRKMAAEA